MSLDIQILGYEQQKISKKTHVVSSPLLTLDLRGQHQTGPDGLGSSKTKVILGFQIITQEDLVGNECIEHEDVKTA